MSPSAAQSALNSNTFTIETWFRRDGTGVGTTTGTRRPRERHPAASPRGPRAGGTAQRQHELVPRHRHHDQPARGRLRGRGDGLNHAVIGRQPSSRSDLAPRRHDLRHGHDTSGSTSTASSSGRSPWAATSRPNRPASSTPRSARRSHDRRAGQPASSTASSTRSASGTSPAPPPRSWPTGTSSSPRAPGSSPATASTRAAARAAALDRRRTDRHLSMARCGSPAARLPAGQRGPGLQHRHHRPLQYRGPGGQPRRRCDRCRRRHPHLQRHRPPERRHRSTAARASSSGTVVRHQLGRPQRS